MQRLLRETSQSYHRTNQNKTQTSAVNQLLWKLIFRVHNEGKTYQEPDSLSDVFHFIPRWPSILQNQR